MYIIHKPRLCECNSMFWNSSVEFVKWVIIIIIIFVYEKIRSNRIRNNRMTFLCTTWYFHIVVYIHHLISYSVLQEVNEQLPYLIQGYRSSMNSTDSATAQLNLINASQDFIQVHTNLISCSHCEVKSCSVYDFIMKYVQ